MRVLIIGSGAVGSVIAKFLNMNKKVKQIICGDINLKRTRQFVNFKSKKITFEMIDATDEIQIKKVAKDADLIINASLPDFNTTIMKAALKVRTNYQDMCSHLDKSNKPQQLRFNDKFKKEKLVGLINTGISPGITNILAKNESDKLDQIHNIKIRTLVDQYAITPIFAMSPEITLEESTASPIIYRNGLFKFLKPFEEFENYNFPDPIGDRYVYSVYGDEIATLSRNIQTKNIDFKSGGFDIESSKMLYSLGLLSDKPIKIGNESIVPLDFIMGKKPPAIPLPTEMNNMIKEGLIADGHVTIVVESNGKKFNKKMTIKNSIMFPSLKEIAQKSPGATYISYPTGLAAFSFSKIIPLIEKKGIVPPELLHLDLRNYVLTELISNGIQINETISKN